MYLVPVLSIPDDVSLFSSVLADLKYACIDWSQVS